MNVRINRLIAFLAVVAPCSLMLHAQVEVGFNSPKISWNQIDSQNYQIIFPAGREKDAFRVATLIDYISADDSLTLSHPQVKIPIILQNQTVISNGFVTLAPWRSEYNLNPPQFQFAGITPWIDMLTLHEYRHVQQVANARVGFAGKLLRVLFGQGGWAFYNRAVQPRWFLEGDAVHVETMLSNGGRGRSPDFERAYRALRLSGLSYGYEKASFGSFKDFVPSHYNLGYHMTTFARREFGSEVWDNILTDTYSKPGLYRFSKAVKKATGRSTKDLYGAAMADLDEWWSAQDASIKPIPGELISQKPQKVFTNYRYPNYLYNNTLIVQKSSLNQIRTIYQMQDGGESRLFIPGVSLAEHYSIGGGKMVWSEVRFHPRWFNEDYSIIRIYDFNSGRVRKITSKSKLTSPGISPDGKRIAAVEVMAEGAVNLVVLDAQSGKIEHKAPIPAGEFISFPRWRDDNRSIIVPGRDLKGNFLRAYDYQNQSWQELIPSFTGTIDRIFPKGKYVFFSGSLTGVQNIFALDISTTEIFQITDSRFGAFDPAVSPDGKKLAYSDYTAMGFQTRQLVLTNAFWKQPVKPTRQGSDYFEDLLTQEWGDVTAKIPDKEHAVSPFKYLTKGLLNIHSWYPYVTTEEFGFGVLAKNIMRTMAVSGQFTYNTNESSWKTVTGLSYGPFFPILDLEASTGERQSANLISTTDTLSLIVYNGRWKEHTIGAGIRLPFNITHGSYPSNITLSSKYRYYLVDYLDDFTDRARDENFGALDLDFGFQRAQTRAVQNIYPRWAQTLAVNYQQTLGENENQGEIFTVNSSLFFPGLFRNHSLFITGGFQTEDIIDAYRFEDVFTNARGYGSAPFERIYSISANYTLPLWYPDLAIGSLAYFKRLRGNLFYDYSEGRLLNADAQLRSFGVELVTDFRLIRLVEVGAGVRLGRKIDDNDYFAEFFITSISF